MPFLLTVLFRFFYRRIMLVAFVFQQFSFPVFNYSVGFVFLLSPKGAHWRLRFDRKRASQDLKMVLPAVAGRRQIGKLHNAS